MRHNSDGSFDQTFGNGGKVLANLDPNGEGLSALALQPDGKIVAGGSLIQDNSTRGFILARFNTDGSPDQSFGNGGKIVTTFGDFSASAGAIVLQPDGKIIQVGTSGNGYSLALNDFALARFNPDGSLDQSFGNGGKFKTHFDGVYNTGSSATDAVLQSDGKLIVVGGYVNEGAHREFALARYHPDGSLDLTFDSDGKLTTSLGNADASAFAVALQGDGRIAVAGYFHTASRNNDFALARYNRDGSLDPTFGNGGRIITDLFGGTDDTAYALSIQPDGKLLAVGQTGLYPNFKLGLARYQSDGSFDQSFGSAGRIMSDFANAAYSIARQPDGKFVVAGYSANATTDFAVARYLGGMELTAAASRKTHGSAGTFDINLPLAGTPAVECRDGGGSHTLVLTFNNDVTGGSASISEGTAVIAGNPGYSGTTMTVNLTSVNDRQIITVTLNNVTDAFGQTLPQTNIRMSLLLGDVTGTNAVTSSDIAQVKANAGAPLNAANFRSDVTVNGGINSSDIGVVKAAAGGGTRDSQ